MRLVESFLTKNPCYTAGRKITVKGLMLHSVGCPPVSYTHLWHSGKHILSLYYPIEKIVANYTNTFNVYLWMENGSGTVDEGDCIASVSGQAMAAGEAWDGKLEVEDYTTRFAIGGGLDVNGFRESLSMQMKETVNRGFEVYFAERAGISGFCRPVEMEGV